MITLGCDKNRVDSEKMLFRLATAGFTIVDDLTEADVVIINSCAFIEPAKKETIETIFEVDKLRENRLKKLIVTGCFSTRYGDNVDFEEVDRFVNIREEADIVKVIDDLFDKKHTENTTDGRILTTPGHYAYLMISDGCNNKCSYCAIPSIRGRYKSEPIESLVEQAKGLAESGVKELILVAQDTTFYGYDLYKKLALVDLCKELVKLPFWKIRLLYTYPELITDELLDFIDNNEKMAKYLDMPMQHINTDVLKKMNRASTKEKLFDLVGKIRSKKNYFALRSTFIVGFPNETEEGFCELNEFINSQLDYAGFFIFSPEEGTKAYDFRPKVLKSVAKKRLKTLEVSQSASTIKHNDRYLDKVVEVIYEEIDYDRQMFVGRTEYNAPDIDTKVYFTSETPLDIGNIYKVKITQTGFHLVGEIVEEV